MLYLADTNVLLRLANRLDPGHPVVRRAARQLRSLGHTMIALPQNFVEFWHVATRPIANNGFGWSHADTFRNLRILERVFPVSVDPPGAYQEWRRLVVAHQVTGSKVHDARLVAAMIVMSVSHILTFNLIDFSRYASSGIVAVDPSTV